MQWFISQKICHFVIITSFLQLCSDGFGAYTSDSNEIEKLQVKYREKIDGEDDTADEIVPMTGRDYYDTRESRDEIKYDNSYLEKLRGAQEPGDIVVLDSIDARNYKAEIKAGNKAEVLGVNPHYSQPDLYPDFGRRFVLQYPYTESIILSVTEVAKNNIEVEPKNMAPKLVSPELYMAVAQKSALLSAARPKDSKDEIETKTILRNGDYWNAVWKEDVNPLALRTKETKKLESVKANIPPGSKLYDLLSSLKHLSPTLLYVINRRDS